MKRVHIVGPPRSGTTLMLEMMTTGFAFERVAPTEVRVLEPVPAGEGSCLTKYPGDAFAVPPLLEHDPRQWFIVMLRDPRDVVVSVHGDRPGLYWANLGQWLRTFLAVRPVLGHERLVAVRYEDLVRDPDGVQAEIGRRIPHLARRAPFSRFHAAARPSRQSVAAMRGVRPVDDASIGAWRRHKARLAAQIERHGAIADLLIELGYEADARWVEELAGVAPDRRPGHWPDRDPQHYADLARRMLGEKLAPYLASRGIAAAR